MILYLQDKLHFAWHVVPNLAVSICVVSLQTIHARRGNQGDSDLNYLLLGVVFLVVCKLVLLTSYRSCVRLILRAPLPFLACHHSITDFEINAFLNQDSYRLLKFVSDLSFNSRH
jgi:hypothetical protein